MWNESRLAKKFEMWKIECDYQGYMDGYVIKNVTLFSRINHEWNKASLVVTGK